MKMIASARYRSMRMIFNLNLCTAAIFLYLGIHEGVYPKFLN